MELQKVHPIFIRVVCHFWTSDGSESESQAEQKGKKKNHLWAFALNHHTLNGVFIFGSSKKKTNFYEF